MDYGKESAWAAGPVPVVVDEIYSKKSFWKKKRTWIVAATVAVLVLVGVVLGAVYGTKRSRSKPALRQRARPSMLTFCEGLLEARLKGN